MPSPSIQIIATSNESNASEFEVVLPQKYSKSELSERVCGQTRTGIVCVVCQANYTESVVQWGIAIFSQGAFTLCSICIVLSILTVGLLPPALLLTYPLLNKVLAVLGLGDQKIVNSISQKLPISSLKPLFRVVSRTILGSLQVFTSHIDGRSY